MAGTAVKVAFLGDTGDLRRNLQKAEQAMEDAASEARTAGRKIADGMDSAAESSGELASTSAQAAGGIGDVAGALAATGIISEGTAAAADTAAQAIMGITGAADLAEVVMGKLKIAQIGQKIATVASTAATVAQTVATRALGLAMKALPIFAIIAVIALLIAAIVYLWKNNETFRKIVLAVWGAIKKAVSAVVEWFKTKVPAAWDTVKTKTKAAFDKTKALIVGAFNAVKTFFFKYTLPGLIISKWDTIKAKTKAAFDAVKGFITRPISAARDTVSNLVDRVVSKISGIKNRISGKFSGMFDGLRSAFFSAVNAVIRGWNSLSFSLPSVDLGPLGKVGGFTLNTPNIPYLAKGGIVTGPTLAMIGEAGAEAVIPLDRLGQFGGVIEIRLSADQVSQLQRGKEIRADLDAWDRAGGRRRS